MSKKFFLSLAVLLCTLLFGQETQYKKISDLPNYEVLKTKINLDDVVVSADKAPEFPGGINSFRKSLSVNMNLSDLPDSLEPMQATLYFVVEKDGYIKKYKAIGDNNKYSRAAENALSRIKDKWKPATINNEPVRYLFALPLTLYSH